MTAAAARVDVLLHVESSEAAFVVQNSVKQRNISQRHRQIGKLTFEADRRRESAPVMSALSDGLARDEASHHSLSSQTHAQKSMAI